MKYHDASWHFGPDNFPRNLPQSAGATHTGMFVAWAILSRLAGQLHIDESQDLVRRLESRTITPAQFFLQACDGKFTDEDLNDEGNAFSAFYFNFDTGAYLKDYERVVGDKLPSLYQVADTWVNFERLKPVLDRRLNAWRTEQVR